MKAKRSRTKAHTPRKILLLLLSLLLLTISMTPIERTATAEEEPLNMRKARTVYYLMDAPRLNLRDEDAHKIDQLNYAFALLKDGEIDLSHMTGLNALRSFLRKNPHIDAVLSIGGWGAEGFSDACLTPESRQKLAASILRTMDEYGFTGVDIDWEYPGVSGTGIVSRPEDVENWYALLELLRNGLDERAALNGCEYILSVAVGAGESHLSVLDLPRLGSLVDQAVLMAYDLRGFDRMTGHHAGLYPGQHQPDTADYAVQTMLSAGFPADRLLLGVPAYGRVWRQVTGMGTGLDQRAGTSGNRTMPFDEVLDLESVGYTRHWDDIAKAAYWFDKNNFVSAEDGESIAVKGRYILENGLLGAAVWQYRQDESGAMLAMLDASLR